MHFSSFIIVAVMAVSAAARFAVLADDVYSIDPRGTDEVMAGPETKVKSSMFRSGDSSESGSDSDSGAKGGGSAHSSPGSSPPSSPRGPGGSSSSSRSSSPEPVDSWFLMEDSAEEQLNRLGDLTPDQRKKIEDEHKEILRDQMAALDATNVEVIKLAHSRGSTDPNIHITATLYGNRKTKQGGMANMKLPSNVGGEKGNFHHIYVNPANRGDGLSIVRTRMKVYYAALQKKQGKSADQVPEI